MIVREARRWWLGAGVGLGLWFLTALALAWRTGWVHLLLVAAVLAIVRAIVHAGSAAPT
jgi:hypothetical protein